MINDAKDQFQATLETRKNILETAALRPVWQTNKLM